jgi:hypothetical protein
MHVLAKIRLYALGEMDKTIAFIDTQEKAIPEKYWLDLPKAEKITLPNHDERSARAFNQRGLL